MFASKFRIYSIGIVAANKPMSSDVAHVVPIEVLPMLDGELTDDRQTLESEGEKANGDRYTVSVDASNAIEATWLNFGTNRRTSPDVRRGERVVIWQYADSDQFYWTSVGMDDNLRKLETVVCAISATQDEDDTELTAENTYSVEASSHGKHITMRTSKADGEPFAYTLQLNTAEGRLTFMDDDDNFIEFDSAERRMTFKNRDVTELRLDKKEIHAYAKDYCRVHIDGPCHVVAPEIHLGETEALEPSVLGQHMWEAMERLIEKINNSKVIGNLGAPTSPIKAVVPVVEQELETEGNVYSKVNKNQ